MRTYFVDAFTNQPFKGSPAAVCLTEGDLDPDLMQRIAMEIGFSETAFVRKETGDRYFIRFFTPKQEIPLCGHATLASSRIIFDTTTLNEIRFVNVAGVELKIGKAEGKIVMQFPVYDTEPVEVPRAVLDALGLDVLLHARYSPNNKIILIETAQAEVLARLQPHYAALIDSYQGINGVLVTARSDQSGFDFEYRYFWPWAGTNEDPVTSGVQTFLTRYWAEKLGKTRLNAFQSSQRTGVMTTELYTDKVLIYGEAVTVFEGQFKL